LKRVMIVDDEQDIRTLVRVMLEDSGYDVVEAESGEKCLELIDTEPVPDLILLDVMMPELDGWETCRKIKEKTDAIVTMLTVRSQDADKIRSLEFAAADWHISKPIEKVRFIKTVEWLLSKTKKDDQNEEDNDSR